MEQQQCTWTAREEVWMQLADFFLDTETRTAIPEAAYWCLERGFTVSEIDHIWRFEVVPAVYGNIWHLCGEWAGWNPEWLVGSIDRSCGRWPNVDSRSGRAVYRMRVGSFDAFRRALVETMEVMLASPPEARSELAARLTLLAEVYFDFCAPEFNTFADDLSSLYPDVFLPIFSSLVVSAADESKRQCHARVLAFTSRPRPVP